MANVQHIVTGAGAPADAPPSIGAHYVDTTSKRTYVATGTTAAGDWGQPLQTGAFPIVTGTSAPAAAPPVVGAHYVDTEAKRTYVAVGTASASDWLPIVTGTSALVTGAGAPTSAPPSVGAQYVDTTNKKSYLSTGTASAADWGEPIFKGTPAGGGGGSNGIEYAVTINDDDFMVGGQSVLNWPAGRRVVVFRMSGSYTTYTINLRGMAAEDNVYELLLVVIGGSSAKTLKIVPGVDYSVNTHEVYLLPESAGTPTENGDNSVTFSVPSGVNVFRIIRYFDGTVIATQMQPAVT
ncbi:hypothetical protein [Pseudomonas sp.]|uniref:hypothetical protein n=1 Tax=Pseudomonas sp. TaxID=306 RepID=UPI0025D1C787|nr:hypothetical protein [Pseudomonas sp.]